VKIRIQLLALLLVSILATSVFAASCTNFPFSNWTTSWTDSVSQTRYSISAPCKVYIGVPFNITAKVTDTNWANTEVAYPWYVQDTYSTSSKKYTNRIDQYGTAVYGPGTIVTDANRQWQTIISMTYSGTPYNHTYGFYFIDEGSGYEPFAHHIAKTLIGGLTVDPYLITLAPNYSISQAQQNTTTIPSTVYNPQGTALTFRWLEGTTVYKMLSSNASGYIDVPLNLAEIPPLSVGTHNLKLEASDGTATATADVIITVAASSSNSPPVISGSPATSIVAGSYYSFTPTASDPENSLLSFSITNKPSWATFNSSTGALTGTAGTGIYSSIQISVSDGSHSASLPPFSINVASSGGGSGGSPVPVMEGWWLVPGVLAGIGMFARRLKG
jgi:hypothetical protein